MSLYTGALAALSLILAVEANSVRKLLFWRISPPALAVNLFLAGALICQSTLAFAKDSEAPSQGFDRIEAATDITTLNVGTGQVIRFDRPVASIFVADPEIADVQAYSPTLIYTFAKSTGTTTLFAVDADEQLILRRNIRVTHALQSLSEAISAAAPDGAVKVSSIQGGIIIEGTVARPSDSHDIALIAQNYLGDEETLINRLQVNGSVQVNLRVRVAEMSREVTKLFGINIDAAAQVGDTFFSFLSGRSFLSEDRSTFSRFIDNNGPAGAALGSYTGNDFAIDGIIDALEREGLASILAEPNLTALSGQTATFLAGGEFPVPIGRSDNEIEIQFKEFGVRLAFTPTVLNKNRISLQVRPEVSDLDFSNALELSGVLVPALKTRRAETTIELGSGQSFAIGGLISSNTQSNLEKYPGLGDVPVLGTLFRSTDFQRSESELVIIVTPYLVRPTRPELLASPTDDFYASNDLERILSGRLRTATSAEGTSVPAISANQGIIGPAGFIFD